MGIPIMRCLLVVLISGFAASALAADTPPADESLAPQAQAAASTATTVDAKPNRSLIEEIIVTGELETTTLKDTAHSVVVFTDDQLRRGTEQDTTALFQRVPNVTTNPLDGTPIIRGIARSGINTGVPGFLGTSGSYVDGYYTASEPSLWDARQAEVQRGPENFISGGAMGGLDAVMTNDPTEVREGRLDVDWAPDSDDEIVGLAYGGPLTDTVAYRVAGYARTRHGFTTNMTRGDHNWNSAEDHLGRAKLLWRPFGDSDTVVRIRVEGRKVSRPNGTNATWTSAPNYDPFDRTTFDDAVARNSDEQRSVYAEFDRRIDDHWRIDAYAGWIEQRLRGESDMDGTAQPLGFVRDPHIDVDDALIQARAFFDDGPWQGYVRQYAVRADFTTGRTDVMTPLDFDGPGPAPPATIRLRYSYATPDWWFIGTQVGVRRTSGRVSAGASLLRSGQLFHADRSVTSSRNGSTGVPGYDAVYDFIAANFFPQADVTGDVSDFNYLPTADVDYALTDAITVGAKYERSARFAGVWFNPFRGTTNDYDDELSDSYDAFLRASAFDGRFTLRANLFYTRIKDQQVYVSLSDAPNDAELVNAQRSHNDGVEFESTWTDGGLNAWLSVGLLEARMDRIEVGDVNFNGNEYPNAPPWTVSLGFTYAHPRGLFVETDLTCRPQSRAFINNDPWRTNEGRQIVNGRIGWAFSNVEVSLYGRNLLDDEYLTIHGGEKPMPGAERLYVTGDPREFGMTVSVML